MDEKESNFPLDDFSFELDPHAQKTIEDRQLKEFKLEQKNLEKTRQREEKERQRLQDSGQITIDEVISPTDELNNDSVEWDIISSPKDRQHQGDNINSERLSRLPEEQKNEAESLSDKVGISYYEACLRLGFNPEKEPKADKQASSKFAAAAIAEARKKLGKIKNDLNEK